MDTVQREMGRCWPSNSSEDAAAQEDQQLPQAKSGKGRFSAKSSGVSTAQLPLACSPGTLIQTYSLQGHERIELCSLKPPGLW